MCFCEIKKKSFTLVEIILAVAISSIILLTLYNGFNLGSQVYGRISQGINPAAQEIIDKISHDLQSAYLFPHGESELIFKGSISSLDFIAPESLKNNFLGQGESHLKKVSFFLEPGKNKNFTFVYTKQSIDITDSQLADLNRREISNLVRALRFNYFDGKEWRGAWNSNQVLPLAVGVTLEFKNIRKQGKNIVYSTIIDIPCGSLVIK